MEIKSVFEEILKKMKKEQDRINEKISSELYSVNECRDEYAEATRCIEIVLEVAEKNFNFNKNDIRKIVKECL